MYVYVYICHRTPSAHSSSKSHCCGLPFTLAAPACRFPLTVSVQVLYLEPMKEWPRRQSSCSTREAW